MTTEEKKEETEAKTTTNSNYTSIEEKLVSWKLMLENVMGDEMIQQALMKRNLTKEKLEEKRELCQSVIELNRKQKIEYGEKLTAYDEYQERREKLRDDFYEYKTLGKIVFEKDEIRKVSLGITKSIKTSFELFVDQVMLFANNTLKDEIAITKFMEVGINKADFEVLKVDVETVMHKKTAADNEASESSMATKERNTAFEKFEKEMRIFTTIAKFALKNEPLMSKKLGF